MKKLILSFLLAAVPLRAAPTNEAVTITSATGAVINTPAVNFPTGQLKYNGTAPATANTASTIVLRDASGNFSAGTITGALTGNATTATALAAARTIGGSSFDGSANVTSFPAAGAIGGTTPAAGTFTALTGTSGSLTGITSFGLRDTGAAFDLSLVATGTGMSAGRTLTLNCGNVAHTVSFGTTANTIAFPNLGGTCTVAVLSAANTFVSSGGNTFQGSPIIMSGDLTALAWTTSGLRIQTVTGTLTDATSSGTVTAAYTNLLGGETIAASSATTFTNYFTLYNKDPIAGANATLTNKWALGADSAKFGTSNQLTITSAGVMTATSPIISGTGTSITNVGTLALRDTSAAFDVTIACTDASTISAGRTLTMSMGNVAHTLAFGTTANTITFPNAASGTVPFLNLAQTFTAAQTVTVAGTASTSQILVAGSIFTGGSATTTKPALLIEPAGATSNAWSTNGTLGAFNGASGFTGNMLDVQLNGSSRFKVNPAHGIQVSTSGSTDAVSVLTTGTTAYSNFGTPDSFAPIATYNSSNAVQMVLSATGLITTYGAITTAGNGVPSILGYGRATAQTAANASVATYTVPAADSSFEVSMNMNVTAATVLSTMLQCDYTDESNTARTMIFPTTSLSGSFLAGGTIAATGAFETPVMHIRCKASTTITLYTAPGTFTSTTYTVEGCIKRIK